MGEPGIDGKTLLRKTLVTVAAMVGACVAIIGTLSVVAVVLVGRAVSPAGEADHGPVLVPADRVHGTPPPPPPGAKPLANPDAPRPNPKPI